MGANQSIPETNNKKTLLSTIDYIAAKYILTSNFQDLKNLTNPEYCNKLVILTSDVLSKYINKTEITYLKQKMEGNIDVLKMSSPSKITYFKKNDISKMDKMSDLQKRRICKSIAKYYVQIFHIYNAIAHTINPIYSWKDDFGSIISVDYEHKNDIPTSVTPTISRVNLCSSRVKGLMPDNTLLTKTENETIELKPTFCDLNKEGNNILSSEPGIPELEQLYYDDYDYNTGSFSSMTTEMKKQYNKDLHTFYTLFTGKKEMDENITKFGQIPLRDYNKIDQCKQNGVFRKKYNGSLKEKLFKQYVDNITEMLKKTEKYQEILLNEVLNQLFQFIDDPDDKSKKIVTIHKNLSNDLLSGLIVKSRTTIFELYKSCEEHYLKGLLLFEAIVEKQIMDTTIKREESIKKQIEQTISISTNT